MLPVQVQLSQDDSKFQGTLDITNPLRTYEEPRQSYQHVSAFDAQKILQQLELENNEQTKFESR